MTAEEELNWLHALVDKQTTRMRGVVNAIRGEPGDDKYWSHHDAVELVTAVVKERDELKRALTKDFDTALGQLRHLYVQMLDGHVVHCDSAAKGLLGPAIERLEKARGVNNG